MEVGEYPYLVGIVAYVISMVQQGACHQMDLLTLA